MTLSVVRRLFTLHELFDHALVEHPSLVVSKVHGSSSLVEVINEGAHLSSELQRATGLHGGSVRLYVEDALAGAASATYAASLLAVPLTILPLRDFGKQSSSAWVVRGDGYALVASGAPHADEGLQWVGSRTIDTDIALEFRTSGSTGKPRAVRSSHGAVLNVVEGIRRVLELDETDRIISVVPLHFDYGYYQLLLGMASGASVFACDRTVVLRSLLVGLERHDPTVAALNPSVLIDLARWMSRGRGRDKAFESVRAVTSTGSPFPSAAWHSIARLFPNAAPYPMYGLTECKRVSIGVPNDYYGDLRHVGRPIPNCRAAVDETGELVVESGSVMTFEADGRTRPAVDAMRSWRLYTGDFGEVNDDGYIEILGRADRLVKVGGYRLSLTLYEEILRSVPEIGDAAALASAGPDSQTVVLVALEPLSEVIDGVGGHTMADLAREALLRALPGPGALPVRLVVMEELPRLMNDKVDYGSLESVLSSQQSQ